MINDELKISLVESGHNEKLLSFYRNYEYHNKYLMASIDYDLYSGCTEIGYFALHLLQNSLARSRALCDGWADAINRENTICINLITRAHFEITGTLAYLHKVLIQKRNNEIPVENAKSILMRLNFGSKLKDSEIDPISVMNLIDEADKQFRKLGRLKKSNFRFLYNYLSEYCHPNLMGMTVGNDYSDDSLLINDIDQPLEGENCNMSFMIINSLELFWLFYLKSLQELIDNENVIAIITS